MPELIAIAYRNPAVATAGRETLLRLDSRYLDDVGDAVIASADINGTINLDQIVNLWAVAPKGDMLHRLLSELLFLHPLLPLIDPVLKDDVSASLAAFGLGSAEVERLREFLEPGQAMMFLWLAQHTPSQFQNALGADGRVVLDRPVEQSKYPPLQAAFARVYQAAVRQRQTAYSGDYVRA